MPSSRLRVSLVKLLLIAFVLLISPICASAKTPKPAKAPAAKPFERLTACRYLPNTWNDGDSFHVTLRDGREQIFRLYFVDTPESGKGYDARSKEQAAYFRIAPAAAMALGQEATAFTSNALSKPFTVQTRWRIALGRSKLPRYYAVVTTADGANLAEALVRNGLARIYGTRTQLPDGTDSRTYLARLKSLEAKAKAARRGGWRK